QKVFLGIQHAQWNRRRVAVLAVGVDVLGLRFRLYAGEDLANGPTLPFAGEPAPTCDAVDVGHHVLRRKCAELAVVQRQLVFHRTENLEVPRRDVRFRHRSEAENGPTVRGGEGLARRNPRRVNAFRNAFTLEEESHLASIGTDRTGPVVPASDANSGRAILASRPKY